MVGTSIHNPTKSEWSWSIQCDVTYLFDHRDIQIVGQSKGKQVENLAANRFNWKTRDFGKRKTTQRLEGTTSSGGYVNYLLSPLSLALSIHHALF